MKIIIVGAGLGGITAAFRLAKSGHDVRLLERAEQLRARGGGISIRASAAKHMQAWGLGHALDEVCDRSASITTRDLHSGEELNTVHDAPGNRDWGASRRIMMDVLAAAAAEAGAQMVLGAAVVSVAETEPGAEARGGNFAATVTLASGEVMGADLVLLADGISSRLRGSVLADLGGPEQFQPVVEDTTLYTFEVPMSALRGDSNNNNNNNKGDDSADGPRRIIAQDSNVTVWVGSTTQDGYVMSRYSNKADEARLLFAVHEKTDQAALWDDRGDVALVRAAFASAHADLADVLRHSAACARWRIAEMPDLPRWHGPRGRVALLGDCAHAMHPSAGQGFASIVEDVGVLDHLLALEPAAGPPRARAVDVPRALRARQAICKPRIDRVRAFSRAMTMGFSGRTAADVKAFAAKMASGPAGVGIEQVVPDKDAAFDSLAFFKWNSFYDSIKEAEAYLAQHPGEM